MIKPEKTTFGQHLERGLTRLGDGIRDSVRMNQDGELMDIKLGLMSDEEKLRFLKQDLYQCARARGSREHIANLRSACATIEESISRKHKRDTEPLTILNTSINVAVIISILAVSFSFPLTAICRRAQSPICNNSRQITNTIIRQFQEPK